MAFKEEIEDLDAAKVRFFEEEQKELERVVNYDFSRSKLDKKIEFYTRVNKLLARIQAYSKSISKRNLTPLELIRTINNLIKKVELLKAKMKKDLQ